MTWTWMPKLAWGREVLPSATHEEQVLEIHDEKAVQLVQELPPVENCSEGALHTIKLPSDGNYPRLDIVAVHGLNGNWEKTWTTKSHQPGHPVMWLRDLLPERFPGAHIMSFEYNARSVGTTSAHGVRENADALIRHLRNAREDNEDENRPIVFIGHSLGGLIIKQALKKASDPRMSKGVKQAGMLDIHNSTKGIVFFGTPHRGADTAKWGALVANIVSATLQRPSGQFIETLQTNSSGLMKISEDFRPLASRYAIASFYEEDAHPLLGTLIVEKMSAVMGLAHEETMMLGGDHSNMCKFGRNDKRWDPVWRAIRRTSKGVSA